MDGQQDTMVSILCRVTLLMDVPGHQDVAWIPVGAGVYVYIYHLGSKPVHPMLFLPAVLCMPLHALESIYIQMPTHVPILHGLSDMSLGYVHGRESNIIICNKHRSS